MRLTAILEVKPPLDRHLAVDYQEGPHRTTVSNWRSSDANNRLGGWGDVRDERAYFAEATEPTIKRGTPRRGGRFYAGALIQTPAGASTLPLHPS